MSKGLIAKEMKCNSPRATPDHPKKSHVVKACEGGKEKVIRFGQKGVKGSPKGTARNKAFRARHAKNIEKGKMSAAFWAAKVKWLFIFAISGSLLAGSYVANSRFSDFF